MILVIGLAGSGKSTQCRMLEETGRYKWLSVGQMLRSRIDDPKHKAVMNMGDVLDDDIVLPLVTEYLKSNQENANLELILDGFPRSIAQAKWIAELKQEKLISVTHAVLIKASPEITLPRLLRRGRTDDHETAILERFAEYEDVIMPILSYLRSEGIPVIEVDGEDTPEAVHMQIVMALEER